VNVLPFQAYHIDLLRAQGVQGAQVGELSIVPGSYASLLTAPLGPAVTVFDHDRIILCGGIIEKSKTHGECWALLAEGAGRHMTWLHYATKRFIDMRRWQRLEAAVQKGFSAGCRWAELLGFEFEGEMRCYSGEDTYLRYARIR